MSLFLRDRFMRFWHSNKESEREREREKRGGEGERGRKGDGSYRF